jgi:hypothetical protein
LRSALPHFGQLSFMWNSGILAASASLFFVKLRALCGLCL